MREVGEASSRDLCSAARVSYSDVCQSYYPRLLLMRARVIEVFSWMRVEET